MIDDELDSMCSDLHELRETLTQIRQSLRDYYRRRTQLDSEIIATFEHTTYEGIEWRKGSQLIVTRYSRARAADRAHVFVEIDRLCQTYAPVLNEKRIVESQEKGLVKAIERRLKSAHAREPHSKRERVPA